MKRKTVAILGTAIFSVVAHIGGALAAGEAIQAQGGPWMLAGTGFLRARNSIRIRI